MMYHITKTDGMQYNYYKFIPAKPLYNCEIVSIHVNIFFCIGICDTIRHLSILMYIHLNVHE